MSIDKGDTLVNKYRVMRLIGEGGNGRVWQAEEVSFSNRAVAIKEPRSDLPASDQEEVQRRYQHEVDIYAALQKVGAPNIVPVYTVEPFNGNRLLVMAYMPGGDLETLLRSHPNGLPVEQSLGIIERILEALQAAHEHPMEIIHRDIKPSNILFDAAGNAYLADFGLAQLSGMSGRSQLHGSRPHPGTPLYMAPEQETSLLSLTPAADIFSLGCVLFEMLTGKRYKRVRAGTTASSLRPNMPAAIDSILAKSLAVDPFDRFSDAHAMADVLISAKAANRPRSTPPAPQPVFPAAQQRATAVATPIATPTQKDIPPLPDSEIPKEQRPKMNMRPRMDAVSPSTQKSSSGVTQPPPRSALSQPSSVQTRPAPTPAPVAQRPKAKKSRSMGWLWWMLIFFAAGLLVWYIYFRPSSPPEVPGGEASPTCGGEIAYGQEVFGEVTAGNECRYVFSGQAGDVIDIRMSKQSGELDPYLTLLDADGNALASNDDSAGNLNSQISGYTLPGSGMYAISAGSVNSASAGTFRLSLNSLGAASAPPPEPQACDGEIAYDQEVFGEVTAGNECRYVFSGQAGDVIDIRMTKQSGELDPYLTLLDADGSALASNDDSAGNLNSQISGYTLPGSGMYAISAGSVNSASAGTFRLSLVRAAAKEAPPPPVFPACSGEIAYGQTVYGEIAPGSDCRFTFSGQAGDAIDIWMTKQRDSLDPVVRLLNANGQELANDDDSAGNNNSHITNFALPESGAYVISAGSYNPEGAGAFELTLNRLSRINPVRIDAENYADASAHVLALDGVDNRFLGYVNDGEWTRYDNVGMGSGSVQSVTARVASDDSGGTIEVRDGDPGGKLIATCSAPYTGGWEVWVTIQCAVNDTVDNGQQIYLVYSGTGTYLMNIDWLDFQ